jgi:hypothetical protein
MLLLSVSSFIFSLAKELLKYDMSYFGKMVYQITNAQVICQDSETVSARCQKHVMVVHRRIVPAGCQQCYANIS